MAGRIVFTPGNPALGENGEVLEGAKFYFYVNSTTTLQNIYGSLANANALTNALANPVIADDAGRLPDIWCPDTYVYTILWRSAEDVTIRTFNDIAPIIVDTVDSTGEPGVYYLQDGPGVLDGTDVDVPALNGYIATIEATPGVLKFPPATLAMSEKSLVLKDGVPIIGQGMDLTELDFSSDTTWAASTGMITATGVGPGAWNPVTVGATKAATTVTASGDLTPYVAKGHVMIRSTEWNRPHISDVAKFIWAPATPIAVGDLTWATGHWYICTTAGTTGAAAPTSIGNPVTDNTATLYYFDYPNSQLQVRWDDLTAVALGVINVTTQGYILVCCVAGTTGATQPVFSPSNSKTTVVDGTVTWRYAGYYNATKGELKPYGIDRVSGTTIYLNEPLEDSYPLSYSGVTFTVEIAPVSLAEIELADMTIRGSGFSQGNLTPVGSGTAIYYTSNQSFDIGLQVKWCILTLRRVRFIDIEQYCWHRLCSVVRTDSVEYIHAPTRIDSQQYGGFAQAAGDVVETNSFCVNSRHLNDGDGSTSLTDYYRGVPGAITVTGSKARGCWQSIVGNHRDSRRLVVTGFDWTVLTAGFKSRCADYVLGDGYIYGPRYATAAEYVAQDGLVTVYYQGMRGSISNVRVDGGIYGLRISDCDGTISGLHVQMEITNALQYGGRLGTAVSDMFNNVNLDLNVFGTISFDDVLLDGTMDNCHIKLRYNGGRKALTSSNLKPALTNCTFDVSGSACSEEAIDLYNVTGGHIFGGERSSSTTNVINRIVDAVAVTIDRATSIGPAAFSGEFWKIQATANGSTHNINMADQVCYTASGVGGTGLTVEANVIESTFGKINTPHTIKISAGASPTNIYADAPNNVQDATYAFNKQDATPGRNVTHTSGSAHTWTLGTIATTGIPVGAQIAFANLGAGVVTISRAGGVVLRLAGADANRSIAQYGAGTLVQITADNWVIYGVGIT